MLRKTGTRLACMTMVAVLISVTLSFAPATVRPVEAVAQQGGGGFGCGSTGTGQITDGRYGYWSFSGKAGDKVTITMTRTSGNLNPVVWLYFSKPGSSDFKWLKTAESVGRSSNAIITDFALPTTGTYSIFPWRSGGRDGTTTGEYSLTLACSAAPAPVTVSDSCPQRGDPIVWEGMIKSRTGNSVETKDGDFWAFKADSGRRVQLLLTTRDFKPSFKLMYRDDSGWQTVAYGVLLPPPTPPPGMIFSVPPTYSIEAKLDHSGCYYVLVRAASNSQGKTGDYGLTYSLR